MANNEDNSFIARIGIIPIVLAPVIILSIIGNSVALWLLIQKKISSPTDVLHLNLTIMNIFTMISETVILLQIIKPLIATEILSRINIIANVFVLYGNPVVMTCIAIDQYIAVVHPIKFQTWRRRQYYVILTIAIWFILFVQSLVAYFITTGPLHELLSCDAQIVLWEENIVVLLCHELFTFFIPILILLSCYAITAKKLIAVGSGKESMTVMKKKALRTILAILALLLCCFAPFHMFELSFGLKSLLGNSGEMIKWYLYYIRPYTWAFTSVNTVFNPLLYIFKSQTFQWRTDFRFVQRILNGKVTSRNVP
ncbi:kappa-type opioid receptor-like [Chiloscyllium plagiosum]|uniref:kappa-type opioid receptor-like n=1 Tax=Chiloscyllium plagiosum TaxID=36176 RepID=UPI001CB7B182|nr:kappa-type opioid receptor-like [Chiloscyllium plagiosum]